MSHMDALTPPPPIKLGTMGNQRKGLFPNMKPVKISSFSPTFQ